VVLEGACVAGNSELEVRSLAAEAGDAAGVVFVAVSVDRRGGQGRRTVHGKNARLGRGDPPELVKGSVQICRLEGRCLLHGRIERLQDLRGRLRNVHGEAPDHGHKYDFGDAVLWDDP
jgi:hypothetical protein